MTIEITGLDEHRSLRTRITRQMNAALGRLTVAPVSAQAAFFDENGPKGGLDSRCTLTVRLPFRPSVRVENIAETPQQAFDRSFDALVRELERYHERQQESRRQEAALRLDGSYGEGGGQILRTALALAVALGRPITLTRIRERRPKPGLQPQHLTVVRALAVIGEAKVVGDDLGSTELSFVPGALRSGEYRFDVGAIRGSAGSVALLFQSLLLPLALARGPSRLTLIGGTHVPWSPSVHYVSDVFLPALRASGIEATVELRCWGWYPAGGGEVSAIVAPARSFRGIDLAPGAGAPPISGLSAVSRLPRSIAERQRARALERLASAGLTAEIGIEEVDRAAGPGTMLYVAARGRAGFCALGRQGLPAERVADGAVDPLIAWLATGTAVDDHLADQLLPFLAMARSPSTYSCPTISRHLRTVMWVVEQFLPVRVRLQDERPARVDIELARTRE